MRNEELKPCPFCGSNELYFGCEFNNPNPERHYVCSCNDLLVKFNESPENYQDYPVDILCINCHKHIVIQKDISEAIEAWNNRV